MPIHEILLRLFLRWHSYCWGGSLASLASTLNRPVDEVVIKGSSLPLFSSPPVPLDQLHLYRWNGASFEAIPFQIDEITDWTLTAAYNATCLAQIPNWPPNTQVCSTNYSFDPATANVVPDDQSGLDSNDEIVFMARDAGPEAPYIAWREGTAESAYVVYISDERVDPDTGKITTHGEGAVYIFRWPSSHTVEYGDAHYVEWEHKGNVADPERPDEACFTNPDPNLAPRKFKACGWARGNAGATGQDIEPTIDTRFVGNWVTNRIRFRAAGNTGSPGYDLLDRFKTRLGDNLAELEESEETWSTNRCPRFLGLKSYNPQTKADPIRLIRLVQGAMSGATTTKTEWYYGTHIKSRIRLRLHYGAPALRMHSDLLSTATPVDIYTALNPNDGTPAGDTAQGDEHADTVGTYATPGPTVYNWTQFDAGSNGAIISFLRETRPFDFRDGPAYYYNDGGTGHPDSPEFEDGRFGNAGVQWQGSSRDMQDRACTEPFPDEAPLYREAELITYAAPPGRNASTYLTWLKNPLATYPVQIAKNTPPPPTPDLPCKPTLSGSGFGDSGYAGHLSVNSNNCPDDTSGYTLHRATEFGAFSYLATIPLGSSYTDRSIRPGLTYRYRVLPFNQYGGYGPSSDAIQFTAIDSAMPLPPENVTAIPLQGGATIEWDRSPSFDTVEYDVYFSLSSGGPYNKVNAQPIGIPSTSFSASNLSSNSSIYVALKAIDFAGNESVFSDEIVLTPLP